MADPIEELLVAVGADLTKFDTELTKGISRGSKQLDKFAKTAGQKLSQLGRSMSMMGLKMSAAITLPIVAFGGLSVKAAIDFESAFAGVIKTVDDATDATGNLTAAGKELRDGFRDLSQVIPISANELAAIGEAAGQLGIRTENILAFTEVMAKLGVTTNLSAQEAALALARLANIMQTPQDQFEQMGSTIVDLGNNMATTEAEIVEMGLRLAGAGKTVGLAEYQVLAFAAALASVGIEAQAGGSAISRAFIEMANSVKGGTKELSLFAQVSGMSIKAFQEQFEEDAPEAMLVFIEGLGRIQRSGGNVFAVLEELGLADVRLRDALLRAAGAGDLFRESLEISADAWRDNNALTKEAEQRFKTTESQLKLLRNAFNELSISIGEIFLPMLNTITQTLIPVIRSIAKLPAPVKVALVAFAAFAALIPPIILALGIFTMSIGGIITAFGGLVTAAGFVVANIAIIAPVVLALLPVIALAVAAFVGFGVAVVAFVKGYQDNIGGLRDKTDEALGNLLRSLESWIPEFAEWGAELVSSIALGILSAVDWVFNAVAGLTSGIADFFPRSPAEKGALRHLREWGQNIALELVAGFNSANLRLLERGVGHMMSVIRKSFSGAAAIEEGMLGAEVLMDALGQLQDLGKFDEASLEAINRLLGDNADLWIVAAEAQEDYRRATEEVDKEFAEREEHIKRIKAGVLFPESEFRDLPEVQAVSMLSEEAKREYLRSLDEQLRADREAAKERKKEAADRLAQKQSVIRVMEQIVQKEKEGAAFGAAAAEKLKGLFDDVKMPEIGELIPKETMDRFEATVQRIQDAFFKVFGGERVIQIPLQEFDELTGKTRTIEEYLAGSDTYAAKMVPHTEHVSGAFDVMGERLGEIAMHLVTIIGHMDKIGTSLDSWRTPVSWVAQKLLDWGTFSKAVVDNLGLAVGFLSKLFGMQAKPPPGPVAPGFFMKGEPGEEALPSLDLGGAATIAGNLFKGALTALQGFVKDSKSEYDKAEAQNKSSWTQMDKDATQAATLMRDNLVGRSIIPDMITAIMGWFDKLIDYLEGLGEPLKILGWNMFAGFGNMALGALYEMATSARDLMNEMLEDFSTGLNDAIAAFNTATGQNKAMIPIPSLATPSAPAQIPSLITGGEILQDTMAFMHKGDKVVGPLTPKAQLGNQLNINAPLVHLGRVNATNKREVDALTRRIDSTVREALSEATEQNIRTGFGTERHGLTQKSVQ